MTDQSDTVPEVLVQEYRRRPRPVRAIRFLDAESGALILKWAGTFAYPVTTDGIDEDITTIMVHTRGGEEMCRLGQWVVEDEGEFKVMQDYVFTDMYEGV